MLADGAGHAATRDGTRAFVHNRLMNENARFCLYDERQLDVVLDGMARRLTGLLGGNADIVLVGVLRRGVPLASRLAERLDRMGVRSPWRLDLEVKRYGDDLALLYPETRLTERQMPAGVALAEKAVVVVDDVLYRGHSLLRVVQFLAARGAGLIRSVVLVDRGVSLLPIHADVTGIRLDVAPSSIVEVHVPPYEADFCVELVQPSHQGRQTAVPEGESPARAGCGALGGLPPLC